MVASKQAGAFVVIVLIISWVFGAYVFAEPSRMWMFNRVMFVPGLTALAMRIVERQGARAIFAPLTARLDLASIVFVILYPLAAIATCALIALVTGLATMGSLNPHIFIPEVTLFAALVVMGEEYGWRGYLLPKLTEWKGQRAATIMVGVVWAVWHAPFLYWLATLLNTAAPIKLCIIQMCAVFAISFPFSYAYFRTRSVIPAMIFHYVWNEYNPKVLGNIYRNQPGLLSGDILTINGEGLLGVAVGAVAALWFYRKLSPGKGGPNRGQ